MEFRVLGPVQAFEAGRPVDLGDRKQRLVMAILLLEANQLVTIGQLIHILWGDRPPATARRIVQTHISRLRCTLNSLRGRAAQPQLARCGEGYLLSCDPQHIDVHQFRAAVEQARRSGEDRERVRILQHALALWRGPALADVADDELRPHLCASLDEARLAALEDRLDAELRLGTRGHLVDDLTELTARHPHRQRLVGQLMLALHQAGRTVDALRHYSGYRAWLVDELGLEPSTDLQRLHVSILRADADSATPPRQLATRPTAAAAIPVRPHQLPADVAHFVGRERLLARLSQLSAPDTTAPAVTPALLVTGMPGVGKTALVTHWAHAHTSVYTDGQLFVDLRGHSNAEPVTEPEALATLLSGLGMPAAQIPARCQEAAALYRSLLAGRRILVVLDDAVSADQVRPLLPGSPACTTIVTSRNRLAGLVARNGAARIEVEPLEPHDSAELAASVLGSTPHEPEALGRLVKRCGHLPLAIRIAATLMADRDGDVGARIGTVHGAGLMDMLQVDGDEDAGVPAAFGRSYIALPSAAAGMLRLLGSARSGSLRAEAAAQLAGTTLETARRALRYLVDANLAREHDGGCFSVHDLVRHYAASLSRGSATSTKLREAAGRAG